MKRRIRTEVERFFECCEPDLSITLLNWIRPKRCRTIRYGRSLNEAVFWKKIKEFTDGDITALCQYCTSNSIPCEDIRYRYKLRVKCILQRLMRYFYFSENTFRLPRDIEVLRYSGNMEKYTIKPLVEYCLVESDKQ